MAFDGPMPEPNPKPLLGMPALDRPGCTVIQRPPKLIRTAEDLEDHTRKGRPLGLDAESHARLTYLFLRREATSAAFRGLIGEPLKARLDEVWANGLTPAGVSPGAAAVAAPAAEGRQAS